MSAPFMAGGSAARPAGPAPSNGGGPLSALAQKTAVFAEMIKWEHSIFALPWAYMGAILAVSGGWPTWAQIGWISLAMVAGRTFAFVANRLIDKEIDARNPRTAGRALPAGLLSSLDAVVFGILCLGLFLLAVFNLAPITHYLWPIVLALFIIYPYTKRFTWLCHMWLGACLGLAPVGAWAAITDRVTDPAPWLLFLVVTFWVGGFDIIYATQDVEIDREQGLKSIPARFGLVGALRITRALHALSVLLLLAVGALLGLGVVYYAGIAVTAVLLAYENSIVHAEDLSRVDAAFFTMNGIVSVLAFLFTFADKLIGA